MQQRLHKKYQNHHETQEFPSVLLGPVHTKDASANAVIGAQGKARGAA